MTAIDETYEMPPLTTAVFEAIGKAAGLGARGDADGLLAIATDLEAWVNEHYEPKPPPLVHLYAGSDNGCPRCGGVFEESSRITLTPDDATCKPKG